VREVLLETAEVLIQNWRECPFLGDNIAHEISDSLLLYPRTIGLYFLILVDAFAVVNHHVYQVGQNLPLSIGIVY
jgi:hypothetical protein